MLNLLKLLSVSNLLINFVTLFTYLLIYLFLFTYVLDFSSLNVKRNLT